MPALSGGTRRGRDGTANTPSAAARTTTSQPLDLPAYEPLTCALSAEAKNKLASFANARDTRRYEDHVKKSFHHLGKNVAAINDRLVERQEEWRRLVDKRAQDEKSEYEKNQRELKAEEWVPALESEVETLSAAYEKGHRDLVDRQVAVQDEREAAAAMAAHFAGLPSGVPPAQQQRRRRRAEAKTEAGEEEGHSGGEDENENESENDEPDQYPPPDRDPLTVLLEHRAAKAAEYEAMTHHQRYALNNDYAAFRKLWHDAKFGDDNIPLPDPSRWFDDEGNAVMAKPRKRRGGDDPGADGEKEEDEEEEEEEDLVLEGEHQDFSCPLSMQTITEPYSNHKCRHTFQKGSVIEWLNERAYRGRARQCPVPGCDKTFSLSDFYFDELALRKIEREKKRREREEAEEAGEEGGHRGGGYDDDDDDDGGSGSRVKSEAKAGHRNKKKKVVEDIVDDENDD